MTTIQPDAEFYRINGLPRRAWTDAQIEQLVEHYTNQLKTPYGTQRLFPVQALAIHEAAICGGLFGPIGCGEGKTLISLLIPQVIPCETFLLALPANLKRKTKEELSEIGQHWRLPRNMHIRSYSELAIESRSDELDSINPDLIVCDEAHKLKNQGAAVTRRMGRFLEGKRSCRVVLLSGTMLTSDLGDLVHLGAWSLRERSPFPYVPETVYAWKSATRQVRGFALEPEISPGPLGAWPIDGDEQPFTSTEFIRRAIRKRALDTAGVVASSKGEQFEGTILVNPLIVDLPAEVDALFRKLRTDWTTPNGWALASPMQMWAKARELALGFHYSWDPFAPRSWLAARSDYARLVRQTIDYNEDPNVRLDSERQVRSWLERGGGDPELRTSWQVWEAAAPTFTANKIIIWHDQSVLRACAKWAKAKPGIVWVDHVEFGRELSKQTGMPFYCREAEDDNGQHVRNHSPKESMICSVESCGTGQNLQAWNRNLWTAPRGKSPEQLIARTHRPGQLKDEVIFDVLLSCREHLEAIPRALEHARMVVSTLPNATQKLLRADVDWPDVEEHGRGYAYETNRSRPFNIEDLLDELDT